MRYVLCDGEVLPADRGLVDSRDRTLLYGLGAFETFRLYGGVPFRIGKHLARLQRSLDAVGLDLPPTVARLPDGVRALADANGVRSAMCRVTVTAGSAPDDDPVSAMRVLAHLRGVPRPWSGRRVVVGLAPMVTRAGSPISGVKSTNYLGNYMLRAKAEAAEQADVLMLDDQGRVSEASVSNVFVVRDGVLVTPPVEAGLLEGVTRAEVLDIAAELGLPTREAFLPLEDVRTAQACFLTGAGKGLVAVDEVDGTDLPGERPEVEALAAGLARRIAACCGIDAAEVRF